MHSILKPVFPFRIFSLCCLLLCLAACGGGGGGSSSAPPEITPPAPAPEPLPEPEPEPAPPPVAQGYPLFESGQVRPLAWSRDGSRLYVANTPANQLEIYQVSAAALSLLSVVPVGLEPVAVAVAPDDSVWVVNHLSDSVSVVATGDVPRVIQTLLVGDEPRDIVFAGENGKLAFISAAARGQNHPTFDPEDLSTAGLGRADLWVYDASALDPSDLNGGPLSILNLFADSLRSLAVSADGNRVYAATFFSGNQTTVVDATAAEGNKPSPGVDHDGVAAPTTGLIVRRNGNGLWLDEDGSDWSSAVNFDLPDYDIFEIDASNNAPSLRRQVSGVGTTLFNLAFNPVRSELYVSNLEAFNEVRFEGPGELTSTVRGRIAETRISVLTNSDVTPVHLNSHVDFSRAEGVAGPAAEAANSLSQVTSMVVSADGKTLYAAALGSNKVAFLDTATLATGYTADAANHLSLPGGGPSGLALSPDGSQLAVYTRFDNSVVLVNTQTRELLGSHALNNPEPDFVITGRPFLYDATLTSANGTSACSSCHIFGDTDNLAWDLGNPHASVTVHSNGFVPNSPTSSSLHAMKGPMSTQTLRGIGDSGPMHWRGDRTGAKPAMVGGQLESIEAAAFKEFGPAFVGLVGRAEPLTTEQMQAFTDFALAITPPPNPIRKLDNSLTPGQAAGRDTYFNVPDITGIGGCNDCHVLDPLQNQFGTSGLMSFEGPRVAEDFKVPHLRNAYSKVGMFGSSSPNSDGAFMGDQVRGFGFLHDGAIDTLDNFFKDGVFVFPEPVDQTRADIVRFVMVMDSNLAPIVGQQITLSTDAGAMLRRLDLLESRALITDPRAECELQVSGYLEGAAIRLHLSEADTYSGDGASYSSSQLRAAALLEGQELTFTCLPPL